MTLTNREYAVLGDLQAANDDLLRGNMRNGWAVPADCNVHAGERPDRILAKLNGLGLAGRRGIPGPRGKLQWLYMISAAGRAALVFYHARLMKQRQRAFDAVAA